jgi:hypothetical protein
MLTVVAFVGLSGTLLDEQQPASMVPLDKSFNAPAAARSLPQLGPRIGLIQNDSDPPFKFLRRFAFYKTPKWVFVKKDRPFPPEPFCRHHL